MKNKITITGANKVFFAFTIIFFSFQIVIGLVLMLYSLLNPDADTTDNIFTRNFYNIILINELVLILVPVLFYAFIKKLDFKTIFRFNKLGFLPALLIVLISFFAYFAVLAMNSVVIFLLQYVGNIPPQPIPVPKTIAELALGILFIGVLPGFCEEMLNRGVMLKAYERRGTIRAVVISGIFFGIFHFDLTNLLGPAFLGILFGYYVIRTNSIFAGMLAHFMNNTIAELLQFLQRNAAVSNEPIKISIVQLISIIIIGAVCFGIGTGLFMLFKYVTNGKQTYNPPISSVGRDAVDIISHWPVIIVLVLYLFSSFLTIATIAAS